MSATTIPRSTWQAVAKPALAALIARSTVEWASKPWLGPVLFLSGYFTALVGNDRRDHMDRLSSAVR